MLPTNANAISDGLEIFVMSHFVHLAVTTDTVLMDRSVNAILDTIAAILHHYVIHSSVLTLIQIVFTATTLNA